MNRLDGVDGRLGVQVGREVAHTVAVGGTEPRHGPVGECLRDRTLDIAFRESQHAVDTRSRVAAEIVHVPVAHVVFAGRDPLVAVDAAEPAAPERAPGVGVAASRQPVVAERTHRDCRRLREFVDDRVGAAGHTVPEGGGRLVSFGRRAVVAACRRRVCRPAPRGSRQGYPPHAPNAVVNHDRIHSRPPQQDPERWREGEIVSVAERDGHAVFTVAPVGAGSDGDGTDDAPGDAGGAADNTSGATDDTSGATTDADERPTVELTVTTAVRELVCGRLEIDDGESPVGEHVWFRERGG